MKDNPTKEIKYINLLIHVFASLHALSSLLANLMGYNDEVILTALTISMIVLIATRYSFPLEVTFALALLNCFAGFYLGNLGATMISNFVALEGVLSNVLTTFIITEFLGWITYLIVTTKRVDA
ncbi:MAG: hypothetical protein ACRC6R_03935 [Bacteroidales bacterium]